ncbi:MAG: hypothetical protein EBT95_10790, partial [Verrucomicrobia bacterium]|nr:hypothetical protein [Verrucomicrobiota bacterium]
ISQGVVQLGNGGTSGDIGTGTVTNNAKLIVNRGGTFSLTNLIVGTGLVEINGTATVSMGTSTAANTYSGGTTVNGGNLIANGPNNASFGTAGTGLLTINNSGKVTVTSDNALWSVSGITINAGGNLDISNGVSMHLRPLILRGGTITGPSVMSSTANVQTWGTYNLDTGLTAGGVAETSVISAMGGTVNQTGGTIFNVLSGATNGTDLLVSGSLVNLFSTGVIKSGDGVMVLSATNTYTGITQVQDGILRAGSTQAFGVNTAVTLSNKAGARLDLNGFNNTIGSLAGGGATGGNITLGSGNLTVGADSGTGSFGGVISGTGAVTKRGTGTQTLTGQNTFSGLFTQNQGVTVLANSNGPALFNGQGGDIVIGNIGGGSTYS